MTGIRRWAVGVRKRAGFVLSVCALPLCSWNLSFNAVAIPFKELLNLTQSQVELVSSMSQVGVALSCVEPLVSARFGYDVVYVLGWLVSVTSMAMFYFVAVNKSHFQGRAWQIGFCQLLAAFSTFALSLRFMNIGVRNFSRRHTGKITGLYTGMGATGKIVYAAMIQAFSPSNLDNFFATVGILWAVVLGGCVFLHRLEAVDWEAGDTPEDEEQPLKPPSPEEVFTSGQILRSCRFHSTFWPSVFFLGCTYCFMNNLTSMGDSASMVYPFLLVHELAVVITTSRILLGVMFDKVSSATGKFVLITLCYGCFVAAMLLGIFWFNEPSVYVVTLLVGMGMAGAYSLPISLLAGMFGRANYSLITASISLVTPVVVILCQTATGLLYDREARGQSSQSNCVGPVCFRWAFVLMLGLTSGSSILNTARFCYAKDISVTAR